MNDKERLQYIKEELQAIIKEQKPILNELLFMNGCLKDLVRVSEGKAPERI